jgi:tetratricopeptide (TPR) repeat protein
MGVLYNKLEKYNKSIHYLEDALDIYIKYDSRKEIAAVLHNLGTALNNWGKQEEALDCFNRSLNIKTEFEDQRVLASGYNQIANVYYTIGDYSLAIENAKRSLGYYKILGNMQYGAYCMIVLADCFTQLGMFSKSVKNLESAQEIIEEFNNLFVLGKMDVLYGIKYFNEGNYEKSVSCYEEGIDKMQLDESKKWVLHYSMEMINVLLYQKEFEKALKYIKRCKLLLKKTADTDKRDEILLDSMEFYIEFIHSRGDAAKLEPFYQNVHKSSEAHYLSWYYLANTFTEAGMTSKSQECMKEARDLLKAEENKISDPSHRISFINNRILHLAITN